MALCKDEGCRGLVQGKSRPGRLRHSRMGRNLRCKQVPALPEACRLLGSRFCGPPGFLPVLAYMAGAAAGS